MIIKKDIDTQKKAAVQWFKFLQSEITKEFLLLEKQKGNSLKGNYLKVKHWKKSKKKNEGGGISTVLKNGKVFDSVGINFSEVNGHFSKKFRHQIPGASKNPKYWASGISVVAHMKNPKIPALHFNTRFIVTSKDWFGGGIDATPCLNDSKEKIKFQNKLKEICNKYNKNYYPKYKKWCDEYFYLPHRNETRGIGGIFFDYKKNKWRKDFSFVRDLGICFLNSAKTMIRKKINTKWTKNQKDTQLYKRGRYVEFNLLYDRGTKFGLNTGGNVEAILMSLPPSAKWK